MPDVIEQLLIDYFVGHYRHRDQLEVCSEDNRSMAPIDELDKPTLERNGWKPGR